MRELVVQRMKIVVKRTLPSTHGAKTSFLNLNVSLISYSAGNWNIKYSAAVGLASRLYRHKNLAKPKGLQDFYRQSMALVYQCPCTMDEQDLLLPGY